MFKVIEGLKYSKEHEWVKVEGDRAYMGITDYAQKSLGEIVYVELPEKGTVLAEGDTLGVVESVKAASDIYTPVSGTVADINEELLDSPGNVNNSPYESWIAVIELGNVNELDTLMGAGEYEKFCEEEED
ncbi:glycine cleavage system protein GcvH [Ruminiclostridium cellobioparum]|uniref:Glycine cleavage system H protein n=1 Tax=Ruminiclostridium cellobioparum subsp. termitidis CT1112 TaxID=1195236 RepID=S0FG43_RUMCE|nr:glycine cleavage system protein GcvH [Ruminiclostridium cellobioparum]EMS70220.1 glycine cleavage system H protein [Ruminiclostridium cellobioparum subsp. termitidis CT1112]